MFRMCSREYACPQKSAETFQSRLRSNNKQHDTTPFLYFRCVSFFQGCHRYLRTRFLASVLVVVPALAAGMGVRGEIREPSAGGIATGGGGAGALLGVDQKRLTRWP